jgi:hypothetical protein
MPRNYQAQIRTPANAAVGLSQGVVEALQKTALKHPSSIRAKFATHPGGFASIPREFEEFLGSAFDDVKAEELPKPPDGLVRVTRGKPPGVMMYIVPAHGGPAGVRFVISGVKVSNLEAWLLEFVNRQRVHPPVPGVGPAHLPPRTVANPPTQQPRDDASPEDPEDVLHEPHKPQQDDSRLGSGIGSGA